MYPKTLEGLFSAISNGSLQDAKKIIESGIDLNATHKNQYVVNYTLNLALPANLKLQIIECLVQAGARTILDNKQNILAQFAELFGELQTVSKDVLDMLANIPNFENFYSHSHLQAMKGIAPGSQETAQQKDRFDLLPIHYALFAKKCGDQWFTSHIYDCKSTVQHEHYEGINVAWLLMYYRRSEIIIQILANMPLEERAKLFAVAPKNPYNFNYDLSFGHMVIIQKQFHIFEYLVEEFETLPAEQCVGLLVKSIENTNNINDGINPLMSLIQANKRRHIHRLTRAAENIATKFRFNILTASPQNSAHVNFNSSIFFELLRHKYYELAVKLAHNLEDEVESEKLFEMLSMGPMNQVNPGHGINVGWMLLDTLELELAQLFVSLTQKFQKYILIKQRFNFLSSTPLDPKSPSYGISTAWQMLRWGLHDHFDSLTADFEYLSMDRLYPFLSAQPCDENHIDYGTSILWQLLDAKQIEIFSRLAQDVECLSADERFKTLMTCPKNPNNKSAGIIVFKLLLQLRQHDRLMTLTEGFTAEQNYALLTSAASNASSPLCGSVTAASVLDFDNNALFKKMLGNLSKDQIAEVLAAKCVTHNLHNEEYNATSVLNILAIGEEALLNSILDNYNYLELQNLQRYEKPFSPGYNTLSYTICSNLLVILKSKLTSENASSSQDHSELVIQIGQLVLNYQDINDIKLQTHTRRQLSDLFYLAIESGYKALFSERLDGVNFSMYRRIKAFAPEFALEGLAHYLRHVNNDENIVMLSISHANLLQEQAELEKEIATLQQLSQLNSPLKPKTPPKFIPSSPSKSVGKSPASPYKSVAARGILFFDKENNAAQPTPDVSSPKTNLRRDLFGAGKTIMHEKEEQAPRSSKRENPFEKDAAPTKQSRPGPNGNQ